MKDYMQFAEKKGHSNDHYPYSKTGMKIFDSMVRYFKVALIFFIIAFIFGVVERHIHITDTESMPVPFAETELTSTGVFSIILDGSRENLGFGEPTGPTVDADTHGFMPGMLQLGKTILTVITLIMFGVSIFGFFVFIMQMTRFSFNVFNRSRQFERNIIKNSFEARFLRNKLIRTTGVKRKIKEIKEKHKESNKNSDKDKKMMNHSEIIEMDKLKALKNVKIYINTRNSLDTEGDVDKQYRVIYSIPNDLEVADSLIKETDKLNNHVSKISNKGVTFGAFFLTDDRQLVISRAWLRTKDKYAERLEESNRPSVTQQSDVQSESEYTFPLSLFPDQRDEVEKKKKAADLWGKRSAPNVTSFLRTKKIDVTFTNSKASSKSVLFVYELAENTNLPAFEKLGEELDSSFNTKGSNAQLDANKLLIVVPLPEKLHVPIDVASIYQQSFG